MPPSSSINCRVHSSFGRKDRVSLAEIKANLEDLERFEVEPLIGLIRTNGFTKDPGGLSLYVSGQLFQLKLRRDAKLAQIKATQEAFQDYSSQRGARSVNEERPAAGATGSGRLAPGVDAPTMIPQFADPRSGSTRLPHSQRL